MATNARNRLYIENAEIPGGTWRNFSGTERKNRHTGKVINAPGKRNFTLFLPTDLADELVREGWNVKFYPGKEEGDEPRPYMKVNVAFGGKYPPTVKLTSINSFTGKKKTEKLEEEDLARLDGIRFSDAGLVIRPYEYDEGKVTAYLHSGFFEYEIDPITAKYDDCFVDESDGSLPFGDE